MRIIVCILFMVLPLAAQASSYDECVLETEVLALADTHYQLQVHAVESYSGHHQVCPLKETQIVDIDIAPDASLQLNGRYRFKYQAYGALGPNGEAHSGTIWTVLPK